MCSSTLSVNCEYVEKTRKSNLTAVPLFFGAVAGLLVCARLTNRGKVGVQRGRKTQVSLPFPAAEAAVSRSAERNSSMRFSEKLTAPG